ncbi:hypothetical protein P8A21_11645 [Streptomyces poriferorum]|uniref:hypothetical protein n=1 Tax=Streptomyces poriferorum TaxID=2798799 RepID=UPI00273D03C7|nr:hypothetical protein [Streptomyces sp. Alt1]WLQ48112.1 hypothetical protein P8A21_11645 [Streptomyces sp. Alt1]
MDEKPDQSHGTFQQGADQRVTFRPLRNGLDYLDDVIDRLTPASDGSPVNARDLKYAILHLQAGAEVLLKARLELEHWTLVVQDALPKTKQGAGVTRTQFTLGRFKTIGLSETLDRLKQVADIDLEEHRQALEDLSETRNALQHYGLDQTAEAIQGQATKVLGFLLWFIDGELYVSLDLQERKTFNSIRNRLSALTDFVAKRMADLAGELGPLASSTVVCPHCQQLALVTGPPDIACRFCFVRWDSPEHAALSYVVKQGERRGIAGPVLCPRCDFAAVVVDIRTAADPEARAALCFECGQTIGIADCAGACGKRLLFAAAVVPGQRCATCPSPVEATVREPAERG